MTWGAVGLAVAFTWWLHILRLPLAQRLAGDAVDYLWIAGSWHGLRDGLGWVGARTMAYPLFVYAVGVAPLRLLDHGDPETLTVVVAAAQFVLHVGAMVCLYRALALPASALPLLVAYPALGGHAAVTLTDAPATALLASALAGLVTHRHLLGGVALGVATLMRPSLLPVAAGVLVIALGWNWNAWRAAVITALMLAWPYAVCTAAYLHPCLANPTVLAGAAGASVRMGRASARYYWSEGVGRAVPDAWIESVSCVCAEAADGASMAKCLTRHPGLLAGMVWRKGVGLADAYHLEPYAADATTRRARWYGRL